MTAAAELKAELEATHKSISLVPKTPEIISLLTQIEIVRRLDRVIELLEQGIKFKPEDFHGKN